MVKNVFCVLVVISLLMVGVVVSAANTGIDMKMTVDEFIQTMPAATWDLGETVHQYNREDIYGVQASWDLAYSNCPFSITISGDNPKGDGIPRFVREETDGNVNGLGTWDSLETLLEPHIIVNGVDTNLTDWAGASAARFPVSQDFLETPHNGQVKLYIKAWINTPIATGYNSPPARLTEIDSEYTYEDSADSGEYNASLDITLSAL